MGHRGLGVDIGASFSGRSLAAAVAPVVNDEDADPETPIQLGDVIHPVAHVACVAVEPDHGYIAPARYEPPVDANAVGRSQPDILEVQPRVAGVLEDDAFGEVDEVPIDHASEPGQ